MRGMFSLGAIGLLTSATVMVAVPTIAAAATPVSQQLSKFPESVTGTSMDEVPAEAMVSVRPREVPGDAVVSVRPREVPADAVVSVQPREVPGDAVVSVRPREVPAEAVVSVQPREVPAIAVVTLQPREIPGGGLVSVRPREVPGAEARIARLDEIVMGADEPLDHGMSAMTGARSDHNAASTVPEPATWIMMILGFWIAAWRLRRVNGGGRGPVPA